MLLNIGFNINNQLTNHWNGSLREVDLIQTLIRAFTNQWFHAIGVWVFASITQSIQKYHREILCAIEVDVILLSRTEKLPFLATESVFEKLSWLRNINRAATLTQRLLGPLLLANICSSLFYVIMFTFYAMEDINKPFSLLWDLSDIVDASVRYWVIAHSADSLHTIVRKYSCIQRNFRIYALSNVM